MNKIALTFVEILLVIAVGALTFALVARKELVQRVRETIGWLLKVSFVDLVQMIIFIRPWKQYAGQTAVGVWLILAYITGKYMIVTQPKLDDIPGPYVPMIGYIYYLSVLFVMSFVLYVAGNLGRKR
jgi:hypothetical protein